MSIAISGAGYRSPIDVSSDGFLAANPPGALAALAERVIACLIGIADADGAFVRDIGGGRTNDIKSWHQWDWPQGVGLYALAIRARQSPAARQALIDWFEARAVESPPVKTINTVAPMLALATHVADTGDARWLPLIDEWGEWVMHSLPRTRERGFQHIVIDFENRGQLWDDTLFMAVMPLAAIGLLRDRLAYVEEARRQFLLHVKYLADRQSGLWFHGWTFDGCHHFSGARWARGNAWITAAIPDFIELLDLPASDGVRGFLIETLVGQLDALAACQRADGMWPTILDDSASYGEASATAGFAYGIMKAVRLGYVDSRYRAMGIAAAQAVIDRIGADGALGDVSFGTPIFATIEAYKQVPLTTMPYGQALALLALGEAEALRP